MDYLDWNDLLVKHFFNSSMSGREVLLYVNDEVIEHLGKPYRAGINDFLGAIKKGPVWVTKTRLCQRALESFDRWRDKDVEHPPYIGYLVFFVLAGVTETDYATYSYYPGLRKLLGEPQEQGMPKDFDRMIELWDDLEKWSREDKHEEFGRFVARIRGGWIHVGLPRSQTVLSNIERKHLPNLFCSAGLDPTDPPSPELIPKILRYYGSSVLENRTKILLESENKEDEVLKKALIELVLDELEDWDGVVLEKITRDTEQIQQYHTSLRLCMKIDSLASKADIYVRFKTNRLFPEENLNLLRSGDDQLWQCHELYRGWSSPLIDYGTNPPVKLNGEFLKWTDGEKFTDSDINWNVRLRGTDVRIFRLGIDGLPDWVETQRLEREVKFLVACKSNNREKIETWGHEGCEHFEPKDFSGLPSGWLLFSGKNAFKSCPAIDILTLSTTVRLHLEGGLKAGKGNIFFKFAPPKIVLENSSGSEKVRANEIPIEKDNIQIPVYTLPENVPCGIPIRLEVCFDDHILSKYIRLKEFDLFGSFDDTPFRNPNGVIISTDLPEKASGAHVYGGEKFIDYQGPDHTFLSKKIVFIGERPGEIATWPYEPYPSAWKPIWAAAQRGRKQWEIIFCGPTEQLKTISNLPAPTGKRSKQRQWKEAIWHNRKRYTLPAIEEVREIWENYLRLAKNV